MKSYRILWAAVLWLCFTNTRAQEAPISKSIQVYVTKINLSVSQLNEFIQKEHATVYNTDLNTRRYSCSFQMKVTGMDRLDQLASKMGYVTQNSFNSHNYQERIKNIEMQKSSKKYENDILYAQLKDTMIERRNRESIQNKILNNLNAISNYEIEANTLRMNASDSMVLVNFTIEDELSTPSNSRVSFVNMPGIEFGYLVVENPKPGLSAAAYYGPNIKYMFTRGKSYFNLGVYKPTVNKTSDTSLINELFIINFGQDFYPRNFGRGKRRYLNLYTGYQIGGFITNRNNDKNSVFIANTNVSFGLELLKTKHVLIDNKVSYFLPLNETNRNMRGILYQASFNFVF